MLNKIFSGWQPRQDEGFPTFWELTLFPAHLDDGDIFSSQNVWKLSHPDVAVGLRKLTEFCCHESFKTYVM
jgi:hypothetical protein